ncbi:membrane-associated lipoprotein involved in thiamine biosynthesis [Rheinheimera sp. A13L]|uniref:FAD:protein FMN transferase n=1 Tax=Rheinheimera sp. A13L TaxID=506534 RepID=UPI0002124907|nr:FAD:protein FMN transferase [Rheinheimera sp. A13L]EGM76607.1 membrane-associated lipoprotein involved in thiamine biosynthesis [Rheinheimera sp. A13L]
MNTASFLGLKQHFFAFVVVVTLAACAKPDNEKVLLEGKTMGTTYHVSYISQPGMPDQQQVQAQIDLALKEVNQVASTYIKDSELSLFNSSDSTEPREASEMLRLLFAEGIRLAQLTDGYLDITVGPLVNLWGFGPTHRPEKVPDDAAITMARTQIGAQYLQLDGTRVYKTKPQLYVDLSTIAKGYGVDLVAEVLEQQGINNFLAEIGGEIRLKGSSLENKDWTVGLEKPVAEGRVLQRLIRPKDNAVATSGDYRIFFEENNQRYSHLIDPKTGKPVTHMMLSSTVIHPSCMTADGLSTAFMVMGPEKAMELADQQQIAALFIVKNQQGEFVELYSKAFEPYL